MSIPLTAVAIIFGALGSTVLFIDWLLSEKTKVELKDAAATWWHRIETFRWHGLLAEDARKSLSYIVRIFGNQPISVRFVLLSVVASLALSGTAILLLAHWLNPLEGTLEYILWVLLPIGAIADWMSLAVTVWFLSVMAKASRIWGWLFLATMDLLVVFIVYALLALPIGVALETNADVPRDVDRQSMGNWENNWESVPITPENQAILARVEPTNDFLVLTSLVAMLGALCPSLLHITMGIGLVMAKVSRPFLQPATSVLLARVYEDKRSVLTLVGLALVAVGAAIKGYEELLKSVP